MALDVDRNGFASVVCVVTSFLTHEPCVLCVTKTFVDSAEVGLAQPISARPSQGHYHERGGAQAKQSISG